MKIERFGDKSSYYAMCKEQQKMKDGRQVAFKEQRMNVVKDFSLNASQKEEGILRGNKACAEAQKRDAIEKKQNGRQRCQHKHEKEELMHELGVQKDVNAIIFLGKAGFQSVKKTEGQSELKEEPCKMLSMDGEQLKHNYEKMNMKLIHQVKAEEGNYRVDYLDGTVQLQGKDYCQQLPRENETFQRSGGASARSSEESCYSNTLSPPQRRPVEKCYSRVQFKGEDAIRRRCNKEDVVEKPGNCAESSSREIQSISLCQTESKAGNLCNAVQFKGENDNERSCYKDCAVQKPRNLTEISSQEDHSTLPGVVESRSYSYLIDYDLYSTAEVEDLLKRESKKEEKRKEEITSSTGRVICSDKKNGRRIIFNKLRLGKKKEAHEEQTEEKVETKSNLQMPSEMKIAKDSVKSLMKKGVKSKIKWKDSKEEEEDKEQMDKQQKKEEKERRKKEDKKRKLQKRYDRVMMEQELEAFEVSRERYFQSYREQEKRFEKLESSGSSSLSNGRFVKGFLKNADVEDRDSAKARGRTVSIAWDDASVVGNNNIDYRITKLSRAKEVNSAIQNSRRGKLSELKTTENGCKAKQDNKKVADNTRNNNNYMDEERMRRIVEMFAAKEHNAAFLKSRASKANGINTTGTGHKPDGIEVIELNHNDSKNDGIDSKIRSVTGYTKTPLQTTESENYNQVESTQHNAQEQRMENYSMRISEVDTC